MEEQHRLIAELSVDCQPEFTSWSHTGDPGQRDRIVEGLSELERALQPGLGIVIPADLGAYRVCGVGVDAGHQDRPGVVVQQAAHNPGYVLAALAGGVHHLSQDLALLTAEVEAGEAKVEHG